MNILEKALKKIDDLTYHTKTSGKNSKLFQMKVEGGNNNDKGS